MADHIFEMLEALRYFYDLDGAAVIKKLILEDYQRVGKHLASLPSFRMKEDPTDGLSQPAKERYYKRSEYIARLQEDANRSEPTQAGLGAKGDPVVIRPTKISVERVVRGSVPSKVSGRDRKSDQQNKQNPPTQKTA